MKGSFFLSKCVLHKLNSETVEINPMNKVGRIINVRKCHTGHTATAKLHIYEKEIMCADAIVNIHKQRMYTAHTLLQSTRHNIISNA